MRREASVFLRSVQHPERMKHRNPRRLLIVASNFAPEPTGIGKYLGEMTERLAVAGIEIRVITTPPYYPSWSVQTGYSGWRYAKQRVAGAAVHRCPIIVPRNPRGAGRLLHLLSFAVSSQPLVLWNALRWRPQVILVVEPPLCSAPGALIAARLCGAHTWLHVQDFEVDAAFDLGVLKGKHARELALSFERYLMRRFDRVSSISVRMLARLKDKGVEPGRIGFFPNWVDTEVIRPLKGPNLLRAELGIDPGTLVLLYSGNMGEKQGLEIIVDVARMFSDTPGVLFLMSGDGVARKRVMAAAAALPNVRFIPLQPAERLNELMNLADVHLLPQRANAEDLVMPSKLTAIMASGRPVVASARGGSDVARAAAEGGLIVEPGDAEAFGMAIRRLLGDVELRSSLGAAGRAYAISNWDREAVLQPVLAQLEASFARG